MLSVQAHVAKWRLLLNDFQLSCELLDVSFFVLGELGIVRPSSTADRVGSLSGHLTLILMVRARRFSGKLSLILQSSGRIDTGTAWLCNRVCGRQLTSLIMQKLLSCEVDGASAVLTSEVIAVQLLLRSI